MPGTTTEPAGDYSELVRIDAGHYVVGEEIARGGMGRILAARDRRLGRIVAIKELTSSTGDLRARFEREARITARLQHPSIVSILEAGTWPTGAPFYAMKLVAGESLDKVIAARKTTRARLELLPNAIAAVDALAYAHHEQVIHRDLKPANVLVGNYGETVVIDWGLAKELGTDEHAPEVGPYRAPAAEHTVAGSVMGTPAYMPVEQARGDAVDARADVYSLGALLYHLLSGRPPYVGNSAQAILDRVLAGPPPPLVDPELPADLIAIVSKAMAYNAEERYANAEALAEDLKNFQAGQLVAAHRYTTGELLRRWLRKHRTGVVAGGLAIAAVATIGVLAIREVVGERDEARTARAAAERASEDARAKEKQAVAAANRAIVERARAAIERDPAETLAVLRELSAEADIGAARIIAADALSRRPASTIWRGHRQTPVGVTISNDGKLVASWDNNALWIWSTDPRVAPILKPWDHIENATFCDDGRLAARRGTEIFTLQPSTGTESYDRNWRVPLIAARCWPTARTFDYQGQIAVPSDDGRGGRGTLSRTKQSVLHFDPVANASRTIKTGGGTIHGAADGIHAVIVGEGGRGEVVSASGPARPIGGLADLTLALSHDASVIVGWGPRVVVVKGGSTKPLAWPTDAPVVVSPDGRFVAQAGERLRVFDTETAEELGWSLPAGSARRLAFSPDGRWLATATEPLRVFDTATWMHITLPSPPVTAIAFSSNSARLVAATDDRSIREWALDPVRPIASRNQRGVAFAADLADGTLVVATDRLRAVTPGRPAQDLAGAVHHVAISNDRTSLAWIAEGAAWKWKLGGGPPRRLGEVDRVRGVAIQGEVVVAWSENARTCTVFESDGKANVVAIGKGSSRVARPTPGPAEARFEAPLPDGLRPSNSALPTIRQGDALPSFEFEAPGIVLSATGHWAAVSPFDRDEAGCSASVHLVDLRTRTERVLPGACGSRPAFSPDERWLATTSATGEIVLWNVADDGKRVLSPAVDSPFSIAVSHDGKTLAAGGHQVLVLFDLEGQRPARRLSDLEHPITTLTFSPTDDRLVGTTAVGAVWLWDVEEGIGRRLRVAGSSASFGADGSIITFWTQRADRVVDDLPKDAPGFSAWLTTLPYRLGATGVTTRD